MLVSSATDTPAHTNYFIQTQSNSLLQVASKDVFQENQCVSVAATNTLLERGYLLLGEASVQAAAGCEPLRTIVLFPPVADFVIPKKSGRPNWIGAWVQ
jgi:hypothetical protein